MNSTSTPPPDAAQLAALGFGPRKNRDGFGRVTKWTFWISWILMGAITATIVLAPRSLVAGYLTGGMAGCGFAQGE